MKYALINCNVFDSVNINDVQKNKIILINDNVIEDILDEWSNDKSYRIVDLKGKYIMTGLINLHAHLFGTGKPSKNLGGGKSQERLVKFVHSKMGKPVIDALVKNHVKQSLNSGVTTIRSSGDFCYSDVRVRDLINKGKMLGPHLYVPGPAITCLGGHGDGTFATASNDPNILSGYVQNRKNNNVDCIKICVTGGVMDAKVKGEPGVVKMTLEQTKAVCNMAHSLGYKVASHTESTKGIEVALEGGVDTIEHGSFLNKKLITMFKKNKAAFIVTSSPAFPLAKLNPKITRLNELCRYNTQYVFDGMISGAKEALKNNIPVGLGTDESCPLVTPYNMWREVWYFTKFYGVSNGFALQTATLGNAKILGVETKCGSIEKGKAADLIVMNDNPLLDIKSLSKIDMVIVGGKILKHPHVKKNKKIEKWLDSLLAD